MIHRITHHAKRYKHHYTISTLVIILGLCAFFYMNSGCSENPTSKGVTAKASWKVVGMRGFSAGTAEGTSLYIYNGTPYVAYKDLGNGSRATVMKYSGTSWEAVGIPGFSAGTADYISLYVYSGTPYVAYKDEGNSSRAMVMKYNGTSWGAVGTTTGLSAGTASFISLYVYNGTPYVAYEDEVNDNKATVMSFEAGSGTWTPVGSAGFSTTTVEYTSLYVYNGTPYVAYSDWNFTEEAAPFTHPPTYHYGKPTVMSFEAGSGTWVPVGPAGFSAGIAWGESLFIYNGIPYLACVDSYSATVNKYNSLLDTWEAIGDPRFDAFLYCPISLYVYNGHPYVSYSRTQYGPISVGSHSFAVESYGSVVLTYADTWAEVGSVGFSIGETSFPSVFVYNGIPYVVFPDSGRNSKATVMKYSP